MEKTKQASALRGTVTQRRAASSRRRAATSMPVQRASRVRPSPTSQLGTTQRAAATQTLQAFGGTRFSAVDTASNTVQAQGSDEEELLQGKFDPIQRQGDLEEEELLQGRFGAHTKPTQFHTTSAPGANHTGMPDGLKSGLEQLSGHDLSGVRVQYNSAKPARLGALAYTQGQNIEVGPGQERHLPHEGWHAVQQMQGRVQPTLQAKGVSINDDPALEREADMMGTKAGTQKIPAPLIGTDLPDTQNGNAITQLVLRNNTDENRALNARLTQQYHDAEEAGDGFSVLSNQEAVHESAIAEYERAKSLRRQAGRLHQDNDGGHITAIDVLDNKIATRRRRLRELRAPRRQPVDRSLQSSMAAMERMRAAEKMERRHNPSYLYGYGAK